MVYKILSIVIPIIEKSKYLMLSLKIKSSNFINLQNNKTAIQKLYESYIFKVVKGDIFPQSSYKTDQIFLEFRTLKNGTLEKKDEDFLIKLLKGNTSKWFVHHVLNYINSFSREMMTNLIEAAIKVKDPSYNNSFLHPAIRVYDLEVNDYLIKKFPNSSIEYKAGILRSFYWVRSRLRESIKPNGSKEKYAAIFEWDGNSFKDNSRMSSIDYQNYKATANKKYNERIVLLLTEYFKIENKKLKDSISWYLPKEINKYPEGYLSLAKEYLSESKK